MNTPIGVVKEENGTIELARKCPFCGKEHSIIVDSQAFFDGAKKIQRRNAYSTRISFFHS